MAADDYELLDSGDGRKFERFGQVTLVRPCSQALWRPRRPDSWRSATATFDREDGNRWYGYQIDHIEHVLDVTKTICFAYNQFDFIVDSLNSSVAHTEPYCIQYVLPMALDLEV